MSTVLRVYDGSRRHDGWGVMARELLGTRELVWRLVVRDLSARYRQSILGYAWALLPPLATVAVFVFLRDQRVLSPRETAIPYPAYVLLGMLSWQLFQGGIMAATESLTKAGSLVSKVPFPREALVLAAIGSTLFDTLLRAGLVALVFTWYGLAPAWSAATLPLVLAPMVLLVAGTGFVLSLAHALVRDVATAVTVALSLLFFLVPVIGPPMDGPITDWNPLAGFIVAAHDVVVVGSLTRPETFANACVVSLLTFFAGWWVFRAAQPIVAERI